MSTTEDAKITKDIPPKKKSILACTSCRKRHIKCTGNGESCDRCLKLGLQCEYLEAEKKIVISMKYLNQLQEQITKLKVENANLRSKNMTKRGELAETSIDNGFALSSKDNEDDERNDNENYNHNDDFNENEKERKNQEVIPPYLETYGRLIHSRTGERLYIGSSSMTLFGLEINRIVTPLLSKDHSNTPMMEATENETILEKEGNAYRIMLGKTKSRPGINVNFTLPSYSYAMLLVDSFISYNDGCFYFFNEGLVKENLRRIYNTNDNDDFKPDYGIDELNANENDNSILKTICFCKLLLIFAIGEMYLGTANYLNGTKLNDRKHKRKRQKSSSDGAKPKGTKLPGSGFFNEASDLFTGLFASGSIDNCTREGGIEVLLLYAFYLQVADCTAASYFYFGIALRASLLLGLHVDIGKDSLNRFELEHRRRLWWTVYMYERMLASKAGLPLSLTDEDISTELPSDFDMSHPNKGCENYIFPEAEFISNCVKITQINANILRKLYTRQPSSNILPIVHELVVSLLKWKKSLPAEISCDYSLENLNISRLVVNMMTEYFQGINLAVRPLLFHFVLNNLKSNNPQNGTYLDLSKYSTLILTLLNASFQASINTIRSLWALVPENMVAMFGYMDREYLFNSTVTLILFNATFGVYEATSRHLDHSLILFTKMRNLGNHPATLRREQILKLLTILDFNHTMKDLIKRHTDNLTPPVSSPNLDKSFGHNMHLSDIPQEHEQKNIHTQEFPPSSFEHLLGSEKHSFTPSQVLNMNLQQNLLDKQPISAFPAGLFKHFDSMTNLMNKHSENSTNGILSPSLSLLFNQMDELPEFEQLSSTSNDLELWKDVTNQAAWLQNDVGDEFGLLMDKSEPR